MTAGSPLYGFDRVDVRPADIEGANFLCAASPNMPFANSIKFYRLTEDGFFSFLDGRARFVGKSENREWQIREAEEFTRFLQQDLGLGYDRDTIQAILTRLNAILRLDKRTTAEGADLL